MIRRKYGNKKVTADGMTFDSKREYARWCDLCLMQKAGEIYLLERQVPFVLAPSVKFDGAKRAQPALRIIVDFTYYLSKSNSFVVEDVKSPASITAAFTIKRHLLLAVHGWDIKVTQ